MIEEIKKVFRHAEEYVETNIELNKLKAVNSITQTLSYVVAMLVVIGGILLFVFMLFIGLAIWIGHSLGRTEYGFFIMAGVMAILCIILYVYRNAFLKKPLLDLLIKKILD